MEPGSGCAILLHNAYVLGMYVRNVFSEHYIMQRALNSAVSGLKAHELKMDVIANNIANLNTVGFKKSKVQFQDVLYQRIRAGAAATAGSAGINPLTVGLGVKIGAVNTIHTQGTLASTGRNLDLAIQGEGYFAVTDGKKTFYTRNGNFDISPVDNALCLPNGMKLQGYGLDANGNIDTSKIQNIVIPLSKSLTATATKNIEFNNNIDKNLAVGGNVDVPFNMIDSLGTKHNMSLRISKTAAGTASWTITSTETPALALGGGTGTITFDTNGKVTATTGGPITLTPPGAAPMSVAVDLKKLTCLDSSTNVSLSNQDGFTAGVLDTFAIADGGVIQGTYSNGMTKVLGKIVTTIFDNPSGLEQLGDGLFDSSLNSGLPQVNSSSSEFNGSIVSGYLESSNVDVSEELTDMIQTQRGFQVSSKVITTVDEMLTDLISMKR